MPSRPRKYVALGSLMRDARERRGIKQAFVADALSISGPWLSMIERGVRRPPASMIEKLVTVLSLSSHEWEELAAAWDVSSPVRGVYPVQLRVLVEDIIDNYCAISPDGIDRIRAALVAELGAAA